MLAQHDVPVKEGQWYRISFRARSEGLGGARVALTIMNTVTWRSLFDYERFAPPAEWKEFTALNAEMAKADLPVITEKKDPLCGE